jgi:hypothetical protein
LYVMTLVGTPMHEASWVAPGNGEFLVSIQTPSVAGMLSLISPPEAVLHGDF